MAGKEGGQYLNQLNIITSPTELGGSKFSVATFHGRKSNHIIFIFRPMRAPILIYIKHKITLTMANMDKYLKKIT